MANYRVYHSTHFDNELRIWDLSLHYEDGSVVNSAIFYMTETNIVVKCKQMLDVEFNLERIFIWSGDRWWGEVCR